MKAVVYEQYGSPDVLALKEVDKPVPKDDEVLVKVHAASVNSWDWDLVRGKPYLYRLLFGLFKPRYRIIGSDIAGHVEAVGKNVKQFQPGDEVFGDISGNGFGAFAEYACAPEKLLALKSPRMTFVQAAAIPQAGVLALQGLRQHGKIQPGQKVLINGAGGGVGTFVIQMAKVWGAEVTAVDHTKKLEMLRSVGADHVIDYTKEDYTVGTQGQMYDRILDNVARRSVFSYRRVLSPQGIFMMVGGSISTIFQVLFLGGLISNLTPKKIKLLMHQPNRKDLEFIQTLVESGKVVPVIDRCYPMSQLPEALRRLGEGHALGKVIITMN